MQDIIAKYLYNTFLSGDIKPLRLHIGPTTLCNLNCMFCWRQGGEKKDNYVSLSRFLSLIDEAAELGIKIIHVQGSGEPFFYKPDLFPVLEAIKKKSMYGNVVTNGTLIDSSKVAAMVELGWDEINFSLDSANSSIHDELRQANGTFDKVIQTISVFNDFKAKYKKDKPIINLHVLLSNRNYKDLKSIFTLAKRLGIRSIHFLPLVIYSSSSAKLALSLQEQLWLQDRLDELLNPENEDFIPSTLDFFRREGKGAFSCQNNDNGQKTFSNQLLMQTKNIFCFEPWYNISIDRAFADYCDVITQNELNIKEFNLKEIWNHPFFSEARQRFLSGRGFEKCKNCCMLDTVCNLRNNIMRQAESS